MDLCHHPTFEVSLHSQNTSLDLRSSTECKTYVRQPASSVRGTRKFSEEPFCSHEDCGDCDNSTAPSTRHYHHLDSSLQCDDHEKSNEEMLTMALLHNKQQHNKQKRKVSVDFPLPTAEVVSREQNNQEEGQTISLASSDQTTSAELKRGVDRNIFQNIGKSCSRRNLFLKPTCQEGSQDIVEIAHSHKELNHNEDKGNSKTPSENDLMSTREDFLQKFREIQQSRFILETSTVPKGARRAAGWLKGLSTRSILSLSPKPSQRKLDVFPDDAKESSKVEDRPTFTREGLLKRRVSDLSIEQLSQRFRRSSMECITRVTSSRYLLEADHTDDSTDRTDLPQKKIERAIPTRGLVHQVSNRMFNYQGSKSYEQDDEDEDDDYHNLSESQNFLFSKMQQVEANNLMSLIRRDE